MDPVTHVRTFNPELYEAIVSTKPYDAVDNPKHYAQYPIQPLEFIVKNNLPYCEGNVIKYVCRWREKGGIEDLKKARVYLNTLIEEYEGVKDSDC